MSIHSVSTATAYVDAFFVKAVAEHRNRIITEINDLIERMFDGKPDTILEYQFSGEPFDKSRYVRGWEISMRVRDEIIELLKEKGWNVYYATGSGTNYSGYTIRFKASTTPFFSY